MKIKYFRNELYNHEYFLKELNPNKFDESNIIALGKDSIYLFPLQETKINPLRGLSKILEINPFDYEELKRAADNWNYKKGREIIEKVHKLNKGYQNI